MLMRDYVDQQYGQGFWDQIFDEREGKNGEFKQSLAEVTGVSIEISELPGTKVRIIPGNDREVTYQSVCDYLLSVLGKIKEEDGYSSFKEFENVVDNPPRTTDRR